MIEDRGEAEIAKNIVEIEEEDKEEADFLFLKKKIVWAGDCSN